MARKAFLLRIDPQVLEAVQQLADAQLRSLNGQIEFMLRQALKGMGGPTGQGAKSSPSVGVSEETGAAGPAQPGGESDAN